MDYVKETKDFLSKNSPKKGYLKILFINVLFKHLKDNGFKSENYTSDLIDTIVNFILNTETKKNKYRKLLILYIDDACGAAFSKDIKIAKEEKPKKAPPAKEKELTTGDDIMPEDIPNKTFDMDFTESMGWDLDNE